MTPVMWHRSAFLEMTNDDKRYAELLINAKAWKACDDSITRPLLLAVTTKPGRPTFSIQLKETKE